MFSVETNNDNAVRDIDQKRQTKNQMENKIHNREEDAIHLLENDPEMLTIKECMGETDDPEIVKELTRQFLAKQQTKHLLQGDQAHRMLSFLYEKIEAIDARSARMEAMLHELIGRKSFGEDVSR